MNRLMLKQESKKKEEEKKKKKQVQEPIRITKEIIRHKLITHFQNHIGESNKTTQEEIFQVVCGVNSYMVNSFARFYFWEQIENVIRELRRKNICFIIKKKGIYFVLKEQDEADYYKKLCDNAIESMENAKERADNWVENESWRDFEKSKGELDINDEYNEEKVGFNTGNKPTKSIEEKIDDKVNNAKTKIIKLWKGEQE